MEQEYIDNEEILNDLREGFKEMDRKDKELKISWRERLTDLVDVDNLFNWLNDMESWTPIDIVDIVETDEKSSGYSSYQHARIMSTDDKYLYLKCNMDKEYAFEGVEYYYVWQTTGYCEDDYSGFMLIPLSNNQFFKIHYSC